MEWLGEVARRWAVVNEGATCPSASPRTSTSSRSTCAVRSLTARRRGACGWPCAPALKVVLEPGEPVEVRPRAHRRPGASCAGTVGLVDGQLDAPGAREAALGRARERGYRGSVRVAVAFRRARARARPPGGQRALGSPPETRRDAGGPERRAAGLREHHARRARGAGRARRGGGSPSSAGSCSTRPSACCDAFFRGVLKGPGIVAIGRAGNPDTMDGARSCSTLATAVLDATGHLVVTPGAVDSARAPAVGPKSSDAASGRGGSPRSWSQDLRPGVEPGTNPGRGAARHLGGPRGVPAQRRPARARLLGPARAGGGVAAAGRRRAQYPRGRLGRPRADPVRPRRGRSMLIRGGTSPLTSENARGYADVAAPDRPSKEKDVVSRQAIG